MRIMVMFDLPSCTSKDLREYRKFRKHLITNGFIMMQESVYCKLVINQTSAGYIMEDIREHCPKDGLVQMLAVTEKQFSRMETIIGDKKSNVIDSDERTLVF